MVKIKSLEETTKKFIDVTPGRATYYKAGVEDASVDWEGPAAAAEGSYETGVTQAISRKAYGKGVKTSGNAKWRRKAGGAGAERYGPGVRESEEDFKAGFAPYHAVIERVVLPPKGPRGDPGNYERTRAIGEALFKERTK